ncbi:serine/threonine protein kinase [Nonomuraea soli]|uniref:non-specific serine/threonine protein kinase n=1 Tax=Nonomuraea soli TaxID=1032476 RepID=A0A7W0CP53_9ACTN|nr:serine/threonine-protein kinase [Nonomuraea soli]MBA2894778.1 serine/threonine protein kinase [Nonomuraea soli]
MQPVDHAPGYRVLDEAGRGGFAVVYRAYQESLDRVVALKVLSVDRVDQRTMRRFQRELQLTGRLTGHPNVVTVFDTGMTRSGKPYIAMDYFENGSLRDRVSREGALPVADVLRAGVKLAGALAAVHEAGVLHGDIKPQNILISRYGEPAIADFGVARVVDSSEVTASGNAFTPLHAAPEVLSGQPHTASTDLYSLGSTLYHLLAGQPAFHNPTDGSIAPLMFRVLSNEPPPIARADVPSAAVQAVVRAMAKKPHERYGTARAFARRLQEVQAELGLPVTDLIGSEPMPGSATVPRPAAPAPSPEPVRGPGPGAPPRSFGAASAWSPEASQARGPSSPAVPAAPASSPVPAAPASSPVPVSPAAQDPTPVPVLDPIRAPQPHAPVPPAVPPAVPPRSALSRAAAGTPSGPGSRLKVIIGATLTVTVVGGAAVAFLLTRDPRTPPKEHLTAPTTPAATAKPDPTVDARALDALRPRRVTVAADNGVTVQLRWTLPANARGYPVVVQRAPAENGPALTALEQGATSTRVSGLTKDVGYCFQVGVALQISEESKVAWSRPACIRGAIPQ